MTTEREAEYIFYMACAVVGKVNVPFPNVRPDWQKIYEISAYHRIENIVAYAVEQLCLNKEYCEQIPDEVKKQFQKARLSGIMRETIQYHEYEKLTKLFEEEGIERMLLKGGLLKYEYPSQDMRFLTDLDILVKTKDLERVSVLLEKLGYRVLHKGGHHDVYQKEPCMTVEIHKDCGTGYETLDNYMEGVWERSTKKEGCQTEYQMSWEDFYLYQTGHMAKHFEHGGAGIRMLLDFLVFENTKMSCCNTKIVENQLTQAKLFTMEKKIRELLQKGKCGESLEKEPVWNYIVQSGTYGLFQFHLQTEVNRYENKKAYFLQRIFPNQEQLIVAYPWLAQYPRRIWMAWIHRLTKKVICSPGKIIGEFRTLRNQDQNKKIRACMKEMGLEEKSEHEN